MYKYIVCLCILSLICACNSQTKDTGNSEPLMNESGCVSQTDSNDRKSKFENEICGQVRFSGEQEELTALSDKMSAYKIPALSLAVIKQGKVDWSEIYQNPDFKEQQVLDCNSIFQAASLSKPVTFMAALRMHTAEKIDLDKNIEDYLEHFDLPQGKQTEEHPVTFRNIFSHTSGITSGGYQGYQRDTTFPSDIAVLKGLECVNSPAIEVVTTPDNALAYSGGGYTLAEVALQDIFHDEFSNIMHKWILEPAGMTNSEFTQPLPDSEQDRVAKGYTSSGTEMVGGWHNHPEQAAAGLWSTAGDLAQFLVETYKGYHGKSNLFSASDINSMLNDERDGLVYGFILNITDKDTTLTHYGGNAGYRTGMTISLTTGNGLAYLINSDNGGSLGNELLLSAARLYGWKTFNQTEVQRVEVESTTLKRLAGKYKWNNQIDLTINYDEANDLLVLIFPNGDEYNLTPIVGDELDFVNPNTGVEVAFLQEDNLRSFKLYGQTAVKL